MAGDVLFIGKTPNALVTSLRSMGIQVREAKLSDDFAAIDPGTFAAVVVSSPDAMKPVRIPAALQEKLEGYVRAGGRALVEYALPDKGGALFGLEFNSEPVFARHERIAVTGGLSGVDLAQGTLLDEQYSHVLTSKKLPDSARRLLDYGVFIGTYARKPVPSRFYEFWVDLGQVCTISKASQRYGGTNPYYCPDEVELLAGLDPGDMKSIRRQSGGWQQSQTASFSFDPVRARYVLFRCARDDSGPGQYWFFAGEISIADTSGANVALLKKTRVLTPVFEHPWEQGRMTDGVIDGIYSDGNSVMLAAVEKGFGEPKWPALVSVPFGNGEALVLTAKLTDWNTMHFRPSAKWAELMRGICLELLPPDARTAAEQSYVPVKAYTEPRRWAPPGEPVKLVVETAPGVRVEAKARGIKVGPLTEASPGKWSSEVSAGAGEHVISVTARSSAGSGSADVKLLVLDRRAAYKRAVERSMRWFLDSGIMPARDGSAGVHSTIFVPTSQGPQEDLGGPIRTDNLGMVIDAYLAFAKVSGDRAWLDRARRLGDMLAGSQRTDIKQASYGSYPWVLTADGKVADGTIWFHDNETRVACALLNLYSQTKDTKYLESALRSVQLALDVSREDYTIANHSVGPDWLNNAGRAGYRELFNYPLRHFDMARWFSAYSVTGDADYLSAASTVARLYDRGYALHTGDQSWAIGPYTRRLLDDRSVDQRIERYAAKQLQDPDVASYGMRMLRGMGEYSLAFRNDCSINTDSEPISDQLYTAPMDLRRAWFAYKATGSKSACKLYTTLADYMVRIQLEDPSPRADGCWVRGFDTQLWEDFGAPYDPNYGPYHAYSGWMNSMIAEGLAFYVLDSDPFALHQELWKQAEPLAEEARRVRPEDRFGSENLALHRDCTISPAPTSGSTTALTDGMIEGDVSDGRSAVWTMPEVGKALTAEITIDLGQSVSLGMVGVRMGGMNDHYNADNIGIEVGDRPEEMRPVASVQAGPSVKWSVWKSFGPVSARHLRLKVSKTRLTAEQDRLVVGEITVLARR